MSDYIKDLNIVDFLGITVPGCLLVLLISGDNPSLLLWTSYFGADAGPAIRGIFLAIAGYVIGMILHEIGDLAEKGVWCFIFLDPKAYAIKAVGIDTIKNAAFRANITLHKAHESDDILAPNIRGILGCILTITILFLCTVGFPAAMNASIGVTAPQALLDSGGEGIATDVGNSSFDLVVALMHGRKQKPEPPLIGQCPFIMSIIILTAIIASLSILAFLLWDRNRKSTSEKQGQYNEETVDQVTDSGKKGVNVPTYWSDLKALCALNPQIQTYIAEKCAPKKLNMFDSFRHVMRNSLIAIAIVNAFSIWHPVDLYRDVALYFAEAGNINSDISMLTFLVCGAVMFAFSRYAHFAYLRYKYGYEAFVSKVMSGDEPETPNYHVVLVQNNSIQEKDEPDTTPEHTPQM